jgi:hypothetical protein
MFSKRSASSIKRCPLSRSELGGGCEAVVDGGVVQVVQQVLERALARHNGLHIEAKHGEHSLHPTPVKYVSRPLIYRADRQTASSWLLLVGSIESKVNVYVKIAKDTPSPGYHTHTMVARTWAHAHVCTPERTPV